MGHLEPRCRPSAAYPEPWSHCAAGFRVRVRLRVQDRVRVRLPLRPKGSGQLNP